VRRLILSLTGNDLRSGRVAQPFIDFAFTAASLHVLAGRFARYHL
jgi:hypothetical protein